MTTPAVDPGTRAAGEASGDGTDSRLVLAGRRLNPAWTLASTARYGNDAWDLKPAQFQAHSKALLLNFAVIPATYRATIKQLCYAMLSGNLPPNEPRPSVGSIRRHLVELRRFTDWLDTGSNPSPAGSNPSPALRQLTRHHLSAYATHLTKTVASPASREVAEVGVRLLWRYRSVLDDPLGVDPLDCEGWGGSIRRARGENSTARIDEAVLGPLLTWALRFVDDFAGDIVTARRRWETIHDGRPQSRLPREEVRPRLQAVLDRYTTSGAPLPGHRGAVNLHALARQIGCTPQHLKVGTAGAAVTALAARNGVTTFPVLDTPVTGLLEGQQWLARIGYASFDPNGVQNLSVLLQTACYLTIAYLSGMRDSEIKHLQRGSVRRHADSTGAAYRWTITSRAFKNEADPAGTVASWVIGSPAARAVAVLEQLQPASADLLFRPLHVPADKPSGAQPFGRTNELLNRLTAWINRYCDHRGRVDTIPPVPGGRLHTRQFRRTLAWHIARRPGGAIAGALQYRHLSIQMFEGYAGTSDSGFRAEVEAEQALARGEHLLAMSTDHDHELSGPAADEARQRLAELSHRTGFDGTVITDPVRLRRIMQRHDPHLYPGDYITCVFDPSKALCQPRPDTAGALRPAASRCQPLDCRNTALTVDNRDALRDEAGRIDIELADRPTLPPLLLHRLTARRDKISNFLTRHDPTGP